MAIASPMGTELSAVRSSVDCITNIDLSEWRRDGVGRLWPVANNYCGGQVSIEVSEFGFQVQVADQPMQI
jgi:hypothetical protein